MGDKSQIEWTEASWNPIVGCTHVSEGCDNCYAARESGGRLKNNPVYAGLTIGSKPPKFTGEIRLLPERLEQPLHWKRPRRIFVNSMSDLFHRDVPDSFIAAVFAVMSNCPQHTFQILTKRPQRMCEFLEKAVVVQDGFEICGEGVGAYWPLPNVWLGTSIESNKWAFRAGHLRATKAAVRFVSAEPLLGPLDQLDLTGIDWLIVGGESGPGARPMHPQWARDLRERCKAGVTLRNALGEPCAIEQGPAFFFKQWGEWAPGHPAPPYTKALIHLHADGAQTYGSLDLKHPDVPAAAMVRVGVRAAGRVLDGRTWDEYPVTT